MTENLAGGSIPLKAFMNIQLKYGQTQVIHEDWPGVTFTLVEIVPGYDRTPCAQLEHPDSDQYLLAKIENCTVVLEQNHVKK